MIWNWNYSPHRRSITVTLLILLVGWSCSLALYLTAESSAEDPFSEFENSRRFANSVERMGGKMALVGNDLSKWFSGLWHGERLACMLAVVTLLVGAGYYFIATGATDDDHGEV